MKIVTMKLSDLHPIEKNVRKHSQKQIYEYTRSVEKFGQTKAMVVDENGTILIGNGLYEALLAMGRETAECYVMAGLSEVDKKKLMLSDNRIFELGMTDTDIFEEIIHELDGDIDVPGWDADLLETLNASITAVNDMVDSYGSYEAEDISRISQRQPVPERQILPNQPLQQPEGTLEADEAADDSPEMETAGGAIPAQERPFVICPKCGEWICL